MKNCCESIVVPASDLHNLIGESGVLQEMTINLELDLEPKMMIRDVHIADRPRERLVRQGAPSLSNQELIAILATNGDKE